MATESASAVQPGLKDRIEAQFQNLDTQTPWLWPPLPRYLLLLLIVIGVVVALWFGWLQGFNDELDAERKREEQLRQEFVKKVTKAVNLDLLRKQLEQVQQYVQQLEKQLPSKAEMDALLSDINQSGQGRSLMFEMFKPGQSVVKNYYAELPIAVKVSGKYHDMGAFASDIAHLSRIVTLNNISISAAKGRPGGLSMEATAKTFRYLDAEEIASQQQAAAKAKNSKKKPGARK